MANSSGMGAKRDQPLLTRYTKTEKGILIRKAKAAGLSLQDYSLCRNLDYPFHMFGGIEPRKKKIKSQNKKTIVPINP